MIVAGTGHRPDKLGGYAPHVTSEWVRLAEYILRLWRPDMVISGMALGWDTYLALGAIRVGIPLTAAIPFNGQESRWPAESQAVYNGILDKAEKIVVVCGGGYSAEKMQRRNIWMVNNCDFLLSCWDGSPGGTRNCLRYAMGKWGAEFERRHYNCFADVDAPVIGA